MKISFWIPATVFYAVSIAFSNSVQVGTVLFTKTDLVRRCWTENNRSLLRARLIMQDILPDPDCIDFSNPKAAVYLLNYFLACFEIVNKFCCGKVQNLMYIALSDAIGGYLRAYVLPSAKRAYYAGQLKYNEAARLFRLHDNIKTFLKTNGRGWAKPQKFSKRNFHVMPLEITRGSIEACENLRIIEKTGKLGHINPPYLGENAVKFAPTVGPEVKTDNCSGKNFKNLKNPKWTSLDTPYSTSTCFNSTCPKCPSERKENDEKKPCRKKKKLNFNSETNSSVKNLVEVPENETRKFPENSENPQRKSRRCRRDGYHGHSSENSSKTVIVPLPVLDDYKNPQSIAVPFKNRPLQSLHSASSAFVLPYYYRTVIECFIAAGNTKTDIKNFNVQFHSWLVSQVLPHLNDEQWYPGFGGVLRIIETTKKFGVAPDFTQPGFHDISYLFEKGVEFELSQPRRGRYPSRNTVVETRLNNKRHIITAVLLVSLLWMFLFCAFAFYKQNRGRARKLRAYSTSSTDSEHGSRFCFCSSSQPPTATNSRTMCFQFFVKFFKNRKPRENRYRDREKQVLWNVINLDNKNRFQKEVREDKSRRETLKKKDLPLPLRRGNRGEGDSGPIEQKTFFKPILPYWPSQNRSFKNNTKGFPEGSAKSYQADKVTLLWKKPTTKVNRNDKRREYLEKMLKEKNSSSGSYSTLYTTSAGDAYKRSIRKKNMCSCCSESFRQTSTSDSNLSSQSKVIFQMRRVLTSTTLECFEDASGKHKPIVKRVITLSTEESEFDDEVSTSYEGDY